MINLHIVFIGYYVPESFRNVQRFERLISKTIFQSRQTYFGKIRSPIFNHQLFWYYFSFGPSVSPTVKMRDEYLMGLNNLELVFNMPPDSYRIIVLKSLWSRSQTFQIILNFYKLV